MDIINKLEGLLQDSTTLEGFLQPILGTDGNTYEKEILKIWLQNNPTLPNSRQQFNIEQLNNSPYNIIAKNLIDSLPLYKKILNNYDNNETQATSKIKNLCATSIQKTLLNDIISNPEIPYAKSI